jgi:hypothetical protein
MSGSIRAKAGSTAIAIAIATVIATAIAPVRSTGALSPQGVKIHLANYLDKVMDLM